MIPFIVGAAVGVAAGYLLADDSKEKNPTNTKPLDDSEIPYWMKENHGGKFSSTETNPLLEDENVSHRIVSDEYVRSKMKKLGREIRRV